MEELQCQIVLDEKNKELNAQGSFRFPLAIYNDLLHIESVPMHWHDEMELIVVVEGAMELWVELEKYTLEAGSGVFINAGRLHACSCVQNTKCEIKSFVFHPRFIFGDVSSVLYEEYLFLLQQESSVNVHKLSTQSVDEIVESYDLFLKKEFAYEFVVREKISRVLIEVMQCNVTKQVVQTQKIRQVKRCKQMMSFIHESYMKQITLTQIAQSAAIKESEALRCFRAVLQVSPIQYLKIYRLLQAAAVLKVSEVSIIEIALSNGFNEVSYFSKCFREHFGCSPTQYRRKNRATM